MPHTFAKVHLCSTQDHPQHNDKIRKWVEHAGGTYSTTLNSSTTHLVCSKHAWRSYQTIVKEARRSKRVKIVKLEWLIDSLTKHSNRAKNRPLPITAYEWEQRKLRASSRRNHPAGVSRGGDDGSSTEQGDTQPQRMMELEELEAIDHSFTLALQRLDHRMSIAGFTPYTDSLNFTYLLTLLRRDTQRLISSHNVRPTDPLSLSLPTIPAILLPRALHPCPLPLHVLPPESPLSCLPVVGMPRGGGVEGGGEGQTGASGKERKSRRCRRVPVSNPAVCALQMFVEDTDDADGAGEPQVRAKGRPHGRAYGKARRFVLAKVEVDRGWRVVEKEVTAAPMGEETAMKVWGSVFRARMGWGWNGSAAIGGAGVVGGAGAGAGAGYGGQERHMREQNVCTWEGRECLWRAGDWTGVDERRTGRGQQQGKVQVGESVGEAEVPGEGL